MARNLEDTAKHLIRILRQGGQSSVVLNKYLIDATDKILYALLKMVRKGATEKEIVVYINETFRGVSAGAAEKLFNALHKVARSEYANSIAYLGTLAGAGAVSEYVVTKKFVRRVLSLPIGDTTATVNDLFVGAIARARNDAVAIVRGAYQNGGTMREVARTILDYVDAVERTRKIRRNADAVARTAVQQVANAARAKTFSDNDDIVAYVLYVATLDHRTSDICMLTDGKCWKIDSADIKTPPLHVGCRSTLTPVLKGESCASVKEQVTRPSVAPKSKEAFDKQGLHTRTGRVRKPSTTARSPLERIDGTTYKDYPGWLASQPQYYQDGILGKAAGARFRAGGLKAALTGIT